MDDDIIHALALAVMLQRTKGYTPSSEMGSNKGMLADLMVQREKADERDSQTADEIATAVLAMTSDEAFDACLNNVKSLLECGYCKASHFGYIAYAPLAFERYQKKTAQKAEREAAKDVERQVSQYVGEIGQRLDIEVSDISLLTSWEGDWGWTYLYKIVDELGNVLIWYASRCIEDNTKKIRGTVKSHSERDGVRQTIVTRCSVVA